MKKLWLLLALPALLLAGCNNATPSEESVESSSAPVQVETKEKLLKNLANLDNYHLGYESLLDLKTKVQGVNMNNVTSLNIDYFVDGKNFKSVVTSDAYSLAKLSDIAASMNKTVDEVAELYEDNDTVLIDKMNDSYKIVTAPSLLEHPLIYEYVEDQNQYLVYQTDKDGEVEDIKYEDYTTPLFEKFITFLTKIIEKAEFNADSSSYDYALTKEDKEDSFFKTLSESFFPELVKSISIKVKDNLPTVIDFIKNNSIASTILQKLTGVINQFVLSMKLDKDDTKVTIPEGDVDCPEHMKSYKVLDDNPEEGHILFCSQCGKNLAKVEAHDYDETHHICKKCGYVKLTNTLYEDKYLLVENKEATTKLYAFSYRKSDVGDYYEVSAFNKIFEDFTKAELDTTESNGTGNDTVSVEYCASLGVAISSTQGFEQTALADDSCYMIVTTVYKLYKNLDINDEGDEPMVGEQTLIDYLEGATPVDTITNYSFYENHTSEQEPKFVKIDDCHTLKYSTCDACGLNFEKEEISNHDYSKQIITASAFQNEVEENEYENALEFVNDNEANMIVIKYTCSHDGAILYHIFDKAKLEGVDHTNEDVEYYEIGIDGEDCSSGTQENTFEHIVDENDSCVLCCL